MPAIDEEVVEAEAEGVDIRFLTAPKEIVARNGEVSGIVCQRMKLGDNDDSGRRRPVPIPEEEFTLEIDSVISAVSQVPDWSGTGDIQSKRGWVDTDEWGATAEAGTYAGGDFKELGLVTDAIAHGTRAAQAIHSSLRNLELPSLDDKPIITSKEINLNNIPVSPRYQSRKLTVRERQENLWAEIRSTIPEKDVVEEASRCISCGTGFNEKKVTPLLSLRRFTQIGIGTLLLNSYFAVFQTKEIYGGVLKSVCVPGLNCHACPTALMGCPIGMMQYFASTHRFPWFLIAFLAIIGLISGRFTCGWLCPFGLVQDAMHAFKRFRVRIPKQLNYLKYAVLVIVVIIIPYFTYEHWFSKLCPSGALMAGIPWVIWNPENPTFGRATILTDQIGALYWLKIWILGIFLMLFLFIKRPFCRTICPLGAIYAVFNSVSFVSLKVKDSCTDCGRCRELCPMDLDFRTEVNNENCIKCLDCTQCEHVKFRWYMPWIDAAKKLPKFEKPPKVREIPLLRILE